MPIKSKGFILSQEYGIGRIVDNDETTVTIRYCTRESFFCVERKIDKHKYQKLPDKVVNAVKELYDYVDFDERTIRRGEEYCNLEHLHKFKYKSNLTVIEAEVTGRDIYHTELNLSYREVSCSCPVYGGNCKHSYALLNYLYFQIGKIEEDMAETVLSDQELIEVSSGGLDEITTKYIQNFFDPELAMRLSAYYDELYSKGKELDYFSDLGKYNINDEQLIASIVDIFVIILRRYNESPPYDFLDLLPLTKFKAFGKKELCFVGQHVFETIEMSRHQLKGEDYLRYEFLHALINDNYEFFLLKLRYSVKHSIESDFFNKYLDAIVKYLTEYDDQTVITFKLLSIIAEKDDRYDDLLKSLLTKLEEYEKPQVFEYLPSRLLSILDINEIVKNYIGFNDFKTQVDALTLIKNEFSKINPDFIGEFACQLADIRDVCETDSLVKRKINEVIELMPRSKLFEKYVEINSAVYSRPRFTTNHFLLDESNYDVEMEDSNWKLYFDITANVVELDDKYKKVFSLMSKTGNLLISVTLSSLREEIPSEYNVFSNMGIRNNYSYFVVNEGSKDKKYQEKLQRADAKFRQYLNDKLDQKLLRQFSLLEKNNILDLTTTLSEDAKVKFAYEFSVTFENEYMLSFLVGTTRSYVVKDAIELFKAFKTNKYLKYGKELAFQHTLENVHPDDRPIINELLNIPLLPSSVLKKRAIKLNEKLVSKLLFMLKGREITWNNQHFLLTLTNKEIKIKINKDYLLLPLIEDYQKLIAIGDNIFIFDEKEKTINLFNGSKANLRLMKFIVKFNGVSIERVKQDFIDKVYVAYKDNFIIDEEIQNEFKIADVVIESYFDITQNQEITLETKFKKHDQPVSVKQILNSYDQLKLNKYQQLIKSLGFIDNILKDDEKILNFLAMDFSKIKEITDVYISEPLERKKVVKFSVPVVKMNHSNGTLDVFLEESKYSDEELYAILNAYKRKKKFVLLKGDQIIKLDDKDISSFSELVEYLSLDKKHLSKHLDRPIYTCLSSFMDVSNIKLDDYLMKMVEDIKHFKTANYEVPKLDADLRKYQIEGYKWLKILSSYKLGGVLADDMGLGKTLEITALIASDESKSPSLIVSPKSLVFNWKSEFDKFAPKENVKMIYGLSQERLKLVKNIKNDKKIIYITSFDSLRNDIDSYESEFNYLVLDEAQYIKNVHALKTQNVKKVKAVHRFALTGTPIENDIFDLWSIFDFLMPKYLPSLSTFKEKANDDDFQAMIAKRVAPFILRRTKKEVLKDLPNKYERVLTAEMSLEQRKLYDAVRLKARDILKSGGKAFNVLPMLMRLRQICVDPRTFVENFTGVSGKTEMLKSLIKEYLEAGHRLLIFSQFVTALQILKTYLDQEKIKYFEITGATSSENRLNYVEQFNDDKSVNVFLISLKAGGNGLNLTGADVVIHYDPWWNVAAENQASDRAYRIGQTRNVEVIRLIAENSIEQRVIELQNKKKDLIDKLISNDTSSIEKVSLDDLKFMLQ